MTEARKLKDIFSPDGKRVVEIWRSGIGLFYFQELSEESDPYAGSYLAPSHGSGLYDSAEAAEREAKATLPWLRGQDAVE